MSAAELRKQVESALAERIPAALSFRPPIAAELLSCGLPEADAVLGGGLPLGGITELTGAPSSGRTTLILSTLAEVTGQEESCAYVDASDSLDPLSASALGVDLRRLLWVRPSSAQSASDQSPMRPKPSPLSDLSGGPIKRSQAPLHDGPGGPCHPRNEAIGLHRAVGKLFQSSHKSPEPFTPRCSESLRRDPMRSVTFTPVTNHPSASSQARPRQQAWTHLDHALRATDLLLSTGGFRAIVLDLGDVSPEQARRVPLATWYRFRLQVEKSRTVFLLMTRVPCANSCAAISLHCRQADIHFEQTATHGPQLLTGLGYRISVARNRAIDPTRKKTTASVETLWNSCTLWSK